MAIREGRRHHLASRGAGVVNGSSRVFEVQRQGPLRGPGR